MAVAKATTPVSRDGVQEVLVRTRSIMASTIPIRISARILFTWFRNVGMGPAPKHMPMSIRSHHPIHTETSSIGQRRATGSQRYPCSNGQSGHYGGSKASSVHSSDVGYTGLGSGFETPVTYGSTSSIPSTISGRSGHADASAYPSAHNIAGDSIYGSDHSSYRSIHDSDSYIYSDRLDGSRRDSHSSASGASAGSVLSNGQVYVPDTQSHASAHGYSVSAAASATQTGSSRASAATQAQTAGHRRSGGNLRSA